MAGTLDLLIHRHVGDLIALVVREVRRCPIYLLYTTYRLDPVSRPRNESLSVR